MKDYWKLTNILSSISNNKINVKYKFNWTNIFKIIKIKFIIFNIVYILIIFLNIIITVYLLDYLEIGDGAHK